MEPLEIIAVINAAMKSVQAMMDLLKRVEAGEEVSDEELAQFKKRRKQLVDDF